MRRLLAGCAGVAAAAALGVTTADAQGTIKIGVVMTLSGQFADAGNQLDNGIKTYMKQHGDTVAGKKIEIIRKDTGGPAPDVAKRLSQELVVRDGVDILAFTFRNETDAVRFREQWPDATQKMRS